MALDQNPAQPEFSRIKFQEIYSSLEWQALEGIDRAQLLLVAENLKPGTYVGGNHSSFLEFIGRMGLANSFNTDPLRLNPVYTIASPERLNQFSRELLLASERADSSEYHRLNGRFLGYPVCCTSEYNEPQKNLKERQAFTHGKFLTNFDYEMNLLIHKTGTYPEELDFCPPSFTPCGAECPEALKVLRQWKDCLEVADPEAAKSLRAFNWYNSPSKILHEQDALEIWSEISRRRKYLSFLSEASDWPQS